MIPPGSADLHVHTTHSDGGCSPCEVVLAASAVGLAAIAITDHDTVSGVAIARTEASRLGIELIAGIELTSEHEGRELHILGYFLRDDDADLVATCREFRSRRDARIAAMVDRLSALRLSVDLPALQRTFPRAAIGRRHLAEWLARSGQVRNRAEAFALYLGDGGPAEVPKPRLPASESIALIRRVGGVAALAHPPYDLRERALEVLVSAGLRGIEVASPGIPKSRRPRLAAWAERFDLVPTAGSDFHANDRPGRWIGSTSTPADALRRLRDRSG